MKPLQQLIDEALAAELAPLNTRIMQQDSEIVLLKARIAELEAVPVPVPLPVPTGVVKFSAPFTEHFSTYGFVEQSKVPGRATMVNVQGRNAVRLHTNTGDNNVAGSGDAERNDLYLAVKGTEDPVVFLEGEEQWWSLSILFPDDFSHPTWQNYIVADFHHHYPTGQANFHVLFKRQADSTQPGILTFRGHGGPVIDGGMYEAPIGFIQKNHWYDFIYHVRWSATNGFFDAWVDGKRKLTHGGPTLYQGIGTVLKLANYHYPVCDPSPACIGTHPPSSVIHGPPTQATTIEALGWKSLDDTWQTVGRL